MPDPRTAVLDTHEIGATLWRAATAMAMDIHLDIKLRGTAPIALRVLQKVYDAEGTFAAYAETDDSKVAIETKNLYALFCTRFAQAACRGPGFIAAYLKEKEAQTERSLQNLQYKFAAVDDINSEVVGDLNNAIDRAQRVKTVANLAFLFFSTFGAGPLATGTISWVTNTAVGGGLTLFTELANTMGEVEGSGAVAFAYESKDALAKGFRNLPTASNAGSNLIGGIGNKTQEVTGTAAQRAGILLAEMEKQNGNLVTNQMTRVVNYMGQKQIAASDIGQKTINLTGQQVRNIEAGADKLTRGMQEELARDASYAAGRRLALTVKGASFFIGLVFMREDLEKAWKGQTAWEREQREKAAHR